MLDAQGKGCWIVFRYHIIELASAGHAVESETTILNNSFFSLNLNLMAHAAIFSYGYDTFRRR